MSYYQMVLSTMGSAEQARKISRQLVESGLAACVQVIGPIVSTYRWKSEVQTDSEWLCLIKTRRKLYLKVQDAITKMHTYEVPEIIAVPITQGSERYLAWLDEVLER